jgi:hypothetical protein
MTTASVLLRDVLAVVLVVAAGSKAADPRSFARSLSSLGLRAIPLQARQAAAYLVIGVEGALGLATAAQIAVVAINWADLVLVLGFAAVSTAALVRGVRVHCRCFGSLSGSSFSRRGVARAWLLVAIAAAAVVLGDARIYVGAQTVLVVTTLFLVGVVAGQAAFALDATVAETT